MGKPKRGLGWGWWFAILVAGGAALSACVTLPTIGWTGWAVVVGLYLFARHLEQQREIIYELQVRNDRDDPDDWTPEP